MRSGLHVPAVPRLMMVARQLEARHPRLLSILVMFGENLLALSSHAAEPSALHEARRRPFMQLLADYEAYLRGERTRAPEDETIDG
jgi:hypothetical protein